MTFRASTEWTLPRRAAAHQAVAGYSRSAKLVRQRNSGHYRHLPADRAREAVCGHCHTELALVSRTPDLARGRGRRPPDHPAGQPRQAARPRERHGRAGRPGSSPPRPGTTRPPRPLSPHHTEWTREIRENAHTAAVLRGCLFQTGPGWRQLISGRSGLSGFPAAGRCSWCRIARRSEAWLPAWLTGWVTVRYVALADGFRWAASCLVLRCWL